MSLLYEDAAKKQQELWERVIVLLNKNREALELNEDACNIDERQWFRDLYTDDEYETFCNWKFEFTPDITDEAINAMSADAAKAVIARESFRINHGLWIPMPEWHRLSDSERAFYKETEPLKYHLQVMTPDHYYLMNYHREYNLGAAYFRYDALYWQIHSALCDRKLGKREERDGLFVRKSRASRFTVRYRGSVMRKLLTRRNYVIGYCIPLANEMQTKVTDPFTKAFENLPDWMKPRTLNPYWKEGKAVPKYKYHYSIKGDEEGLYISCSPIDANGEPSKHSNSVYCYGASKYTKFNGQRLNEAYMDEIGNIEGNFSAAYGELQSCLTIVDQYASGRTGFMLMGGSSAKKPTKNNEILKFIGENPKFYNSYSLFSGYNYTRSDYLDPYGWVYQDEVLSTWNEELQSKIDSGQSQEVLGHLRLRPMKPKHCHYTGDQSGLDVMRIEGHKDNLSKWKDQGFRELVSEDGESYKEPFVIKRGWFQEGTNDLNPVFVPNERGGWYIYQLAKEHLINRKAGKPSFTYIAASDNADDRLADEKERARIEAARQGSKEKSSMCMVVMDTETCETVAMYYYRHVDPEHDYHQMLLGALHYNCYLMPEKNRPGQKNYMLVNYKQGRYKPWLLPNPKRYNVNLGANQKDFGYDTGMEKDVLYYDTLLPFLMGSNGVSDGEGHNGNLEKIYFEQLVEGITSWDIDYKKYTPDTAMAYLLTIVARDFARNVWSKVPRIRGVSDAETSIASGLYKLSQYQPITTSAYKRK